MSESSPFLSLLLITGLAAFVPLLASRLRRIRLPTVVGEILAGDLCGGCASFVAAVTHHRRRRHCL